MLFLKGGAEMAQYRNLGQRLVDHSQLQGESLPGVPIVELAGDRRVLIERHDGVVEYGTEQIRVRVKYGIICVLGCDLQLKQMTKQQLIVSGQINSIQILRRCR